MHTYTPADSIFDGPVTNLLSVLCIWVEILLRAHAKSGESLNDFKFGSCSRFSSDAAASTAVKGLSIVRTEKMCASEKLTTCSFTGSPRQVSVAKVGLLELAERFRMQEEERANDARA